MNKDFNSVIKNAQELLEDKEWVSQYKSYAEAMSVNVDFISKKRKNFREWEPLYFYINTTQAKDSCKKLVLDVRYMGQNVAKITCDNNNRVTISTKGFDDTNRQNFNYDKPLNNVEWKDAKDAKEFLKFFKDRDRVRTSDKKRNEEHNIESMLITEFSRCSGKKKPLRGIQPVKFAGKIRFAMPTVFSASDHNKLRVASKYKGGSIDILARVSARLCVIEVKDKNDPSETPEAALQQAVEYTVFIRELLRSEAGPCWWKLLGFTRQIPAPGKLTLYAACAMPTREPEKKDDESFDGMRFNIDGDSIECHYIYFSLDKSSLQPFKTSFLQER